MSRYFSESNISETSSIQNTLQVNNISSIARLLSINNYSATGSVISQNVFKGQEVLIEAWGAGGSNGLGPRGGIGGNGGYSKSTYLINEDGILQIVVGSIDTGGAGGLGQGQNGGGSSYVYFGNTGSFDLLAVAGGGGGGGGGGSSIDIKGDGGNSNSNGTTAVFSGFPLGRGGGGGDNNSGGAGGVGNNSTPSGGNGSSGMSTNITNVILNLDSLGGNGGGDNPAQAGGGGGGRGFGGGGGGADGGAGLNAAGGGGGGGGGNFGDLNLQDGSLSSSVGTPVPSNVATAGNNGYAIITVFDKNIITETNLIPSESLSLGSSLFPFSNIYSNNYVLMNNSNTLTLSNSSNQLSIASSTGSFIVQPTSKAYVQVTFNSDYTLNAGDIIFDSISATGSISYNTTTGEFSLLANKNYLISITLQEQLANDNSNFTFAVCKSDNTQLSKEFYALGINSTSTQVKVGGNEFIYTPSSNENIKIRTITDNSGLPMAIRSTVYSGCFIKEL